MFWRENTHFDEACCCKIRVWCAVNVEVAKTSGSGLCEQFVLLEVPTPSFKNSNDCSVNNSINNNNTYNNA
jgi:hypothetical protein